MYEYEKMAKYYDLFYSQKDYQKETTFLKDILKNRKKVLDVGCGTGMHMHLLEEAGYDVTGLDLSKSMLDIAKTRVKGSLFSANLLDFTSSNKFDAIISMFAVFNHLTSYEEMEKGLLNLYGLLNTKGVLIIDLHNGRKNGEKVETINNWTRQMKWTFNLKTSREHTDIKYVIDNNIYKDSHEFLIYELSKIEEILIKHNLKYQIYENYTFSIANNHSKNLNIVIYK